MNKSQITQIQSYLKTELVSIFGNDVYYSLPVRSPDTAFLSFEIISNRETECFNKDLLVFTIVWPKGAFTALDLKWYMDILEEKLKNFNKTYWTFETFRTTASERERVFLWEIERWIWEKTFTFNYTNNG